MTQQYITVSPEILLRASRLFNNSPRTIFNELLQNSRRAGATLIDIKTVEEGQGTTVTIKDNGSGMFRDGFKMSLGGSGWDSEKVREEDAAGMGIFSLARCTPTIWSGNFEVRLTEDMFNGKEPVGLKEIDQPVEGTEIRFVLGLPVRDVWITIQESAKYFPVPVILNSQPVEQKPFVDPSTPLWKGLRIARASVPYHRSQSTLNGVRAEINFFGLLISASLPLVDRAFTQLNEGVRIDIVEPGALQMVLPDRNCLVETPFLEELSLKAHEVVARYYESLPEHRLAYMEYAAFKRLFGVNLKEASQKLDIQEYFYTDYIEEHKLNAKELATARILDLNQVTARQVANSFVSSDLKFYKPRPKYNGYSWYDSIPKVTSLEVQVKEGEKTHLIEGEVGAEGLESLPFVADSITLTVPDIGTAEVGSFCWAGYGLSYVDYSPSLTFASDFEPGPLVISRSKSVSDVVDSIVDPIFEPNDDLTRSTEDQKVEFEIELRGVLKNYIGDSLESLRDQISTAWMHHIGYLLPAGYEVIITNPPKIGSLRIEVRQLPEKPTLEEKQQ